MITDIKEKLANMQAKYIDKQSAKDTLKKVELLYLQVVRVIRILQQIHVRL